MKVLIIGGTGNISTAATRDLIARGDEVILYNRGQTGTEFQGSYRLIQGDRKDYPRFEEQVVAAGPFDCVIDMICYTPEEAQSLVQAVRGRTRQVVFSSTVDVYCKPAKNYPIRENAPRGANPAFTYAYNKVVCENILLQAAQEGDFALTIIRNAQTYNSSNYVAGLLIPGPVFLNRLRLGKPVIVIGDGTSLWSLVHRDDAGPTFAAAAGNPRAYGNAYIVAGEEWLTWETIYRMTAEAMQAPPLVPVHIPSDLLARLSPDLRGAVWCDLNFKYDNIFDVSAAQRDLGYHYTVTWEEGIRRILASHESRGLLSGDGKDTLYDAIIGAWERLCEGMRQQVAGT